MLSSVKHGENDDAVGEDWEGRKGMADVSFPIVESRVQANEHNAEDSARSASWAKSHHAACGSYSCHLLALMCHVLLVPFVLQGLLLTRCS